mmetsp:Transcript_16290/g.26372  ORF Transcript_16290/g.26372 Transcript_16290/m.26372 type:complete len:320 (+) Transcript_16290:333-1292(+)
MMITSPTERGKHFHFNGFAPAAGHPNDTMMQAIGQQPTNPNLKRLASCREELERSWRGTQPDLHCVSNDGSGCETDYLENSGRVKRRRTLQSNSNGYDDADMMMNCSFVSGTRISPTNRPRQPQPQALTRPQVKAGWYEGEVDAAGNRHGKGITKHDDGTEYEGPYVNDVMEGSNGRYKFITAKHSVPNPHQNGSLLYRHIEKSFEGSFKNDMPDDKGMIITKTVDTVPQVLGSMPIDVRFMEVTYDVGVYRSEEDGKVVGEGLRVIYSKNYVDGRGTLTKNCFRLFNGENTHVRVGESYANWVFQCMNMDFPQPPSSM